MRAINREILTFVLLVFLFSCVPYALMISTHHLAAGNGMAVFLVMWCPAFAALATSAIHGIDLASLGWNWRPVRYEWIAYLLPIAYALPVYLLTWLLIPGSFTYPAFAQRMAEAFGFPTHPNLVTLGMGLPLYATLGVIRSMTSALGEEIGWRGFLLPRLTGRFGFHLGCLISGAIWAVWHFPGLLWADYNGGTDARYEMACFAVAVISLSYVMGWLRLKSGSLWPCAMLHASHNLFVQAIFDGNTATTGSAPWIVGEFGFGLAITIGITAFFFWRKHGELPAPAALGA